MRKRTMSNQLQDTFKMVLRAIRTPTFYVVRNADTGEVRQHYMKKIRFKESSEVLRASWYMGGDDHNVRRTLWIVQFSLSEELGGIQVQAGSDNIGIVPLQLFTVAGVHGQLVPSHLVALVAPTAETLAGALQSWIDEKYEQHRNSVVEMRL